MKAFDQLVLLMINGKAIAGFSDIYTLLSFCNINGPDTREEIHKSVVCEGVYTGQHSEITIRNWVFPNPVTISVVLLPADDLAPHGRRVLEANAVDVGSQLL